MSERRIVVIMAFGLSAAGPVSLKLWEAMGEQWMGFCLGCFLLSRAVAE